MFSSVLFEKKGFCLRVTSPLVMELKVTWGDKGREGGQNIQFWGDVIYGRSLSLFHNFIGIVQIRIFAVYSSVHSFR